MSDRGRSEGTGAWRVVTALAIVWGLAAAPVAADPWSDTEGSGTLRQRMQDFARRNNEKITAG